MERLKCLVKNGPKDGKLRPFMYSSSLLFVYDGEPSLATIEECDTFRIACIDFAHSDWRESEDSFDKSYMTGLDTLLNMIIQIQRELKIIAL
jgi:hypothetical protein